jgi:hypothetical protein
MLSLPKTNPAKLCRPVLDRPPRFAYRRGPGTLRAAHGTLPSSGGDAALTAIGQALEGGVR